MISTKFIEECKNRANANRLGKITINGIEKPITNSDNLQSFSIDSGCYVDGNIIGSVYAKCLNASFITDIEDLSEKSIYAQIGVKYAENSTEYINMGKYKVERPNGEITANMSQITAYDDLYTNLDNKYVCGIDYSKGNITVRDLYIDICNQLGLTPKTTSFLNDNIPIEDNPFTNGEKNRTVLQTICKISCSFVDIDVETNQIDLCWLSQNNDPDYTFYKNDYSSVEGGQVVCGPINCLIIKNSQIDSENITKKDDKDIAINGEHSITISEDYILHNEELRQLAINNIWNRVHGMKYVDCKLTTYYGKPFLKLGNKIRIYIDDNNTQYIDTYVLKHNFTYDGTFESVIESPALTQQEINSKQDISLGQALLNTQIDVNKQKQEITALVSTVGDIEKDIQTSKKTTTYPIEIKDAGQYDVEELKVYGNSEQETSTEGKNKWNYYIVPSSSDYGTFKVANNSDGSITISGEATTFTTNANSSFQIATGEKAKNMFKPGKVSLIVYDKATGKKVNCIRPYPHVNFKNSSGAIRELNNEPNEGSFTLTQEIIDSEGFRIDAGIYISDTQIATPGTYQVMLYQDDGDENYEPFTPNMPSPDFPSENKNVKGIENVANIPNANEQVLNGVTFSYDKNTNILKLNGTATTANPFNIITLDDLNVTEEDTYTLSIIPISGSWTAGFIGIRAYHDNTQICYVQNRYNQVISSKLMPGFNKSWVFLTDTASFENYECKIVLARGRNIYSNYIPYGSWLPVNVTGNETPKKNQFLIDLNTYDDEGNIIGYHELSKINDIRDELKVINGKLIKRIEKVILTGDENWSYNSIAQGSLFRNIGLIKNSIKDYTTILYSNYYKGIPLNNSSNDRKDGNFYLNYNLNYLDFIDNRFTDVNDFTSWLKQQYDNGTPVIIYYELETPEQIQLTPTTIELFEGYNRITIEDENQLVEEVEMTYLTDSKLNGQYATKTELKLTSDSITSEVNKKVSADNFNSTVEDISNKMTQTANRTDSTIQEILGVNNEQNTKINSLTQTADGLNIEISEQKKLYDSLNGKLVDIEGTLKNMSFDFSTNGLAIATSTDPNNSLLDNTGIKVYNYTKLTAIFNNKGSGIDKLIVTTTAQIGYLKIVKSTKNGKPVTKIYHLKKLIESLGDLE